MVAPAVPPYRVVVTPAVRAQIALIRDLATAQGNAYSVRRILRNAFGDLESNPAAFGDPIHSTRLSGGTVYQALRSPLVFRYAVFPDRKVVLLYDVHRS